MSNDRLDDRFPMDRESPIGEPVVRGDAAVTGERARDAVQFDPDDPASLQEAVERVRAFASGEGAIGDHIYMLEGAAACAALVRGEGSYKAAAERAGGEATVSFIRKWARVHDLPQAIRRHVAMGHIAPTAAKHIARLRGDARYQLAWATLDHELTVRDVRQIASHINQGAAVEEALRTHGIEPGEITVRLPLDTYRELRRAASFEGSEPATIIARALEAWFEPNTADKAYQQRPNR